MRARRDIAAPLCAAVYLAVCTVHTAFAQEQPQEQPMSAYDAAIDSLITGSISPKRALVLTEAGQYCVNIADAAADMRFAWQAETLAKLEKQIDARIEFLQAKRAEYEEWLRRRDEYLSRAEENVIEIYAKMRPDAAARQLTILDYETAAVIVSKLNSRIASTILTEMDAEHAARLTKTMASVTKPVEASQKQ